MTTFKTWASGSVLLLVLLLSQAAAALNPVYTSGLSNKAIKGYDTVAYFTLNKPVKGSKKFSIIYGNALWLFSSQEHLDLFKLNPDKYMPQYGGYCAYAVAINKTASVQPDVFSIIDGKLYLNFNRRIQKRWNKKQAEFITDADKNWPVLLESN